MWEINEYSNRFYLKKDLFYNTYCCYKKRVYKFNIYYPWALANSAVSSDCLAVRINTTITARAHTFEVPARLLSATFPVGFTLVATSG